MRTWQTSPTFIRVFQRRGIAFNPKPQHTGFFSRNTSRYAKTVLLRGFSVIQKCVKGASAKMASVTAMTLE